VPLIAGAYFVGAAGLLLGFGGAVIFGVAIALSSAAAAAAVRSATLVALSVLLGAGVVLGRALDRADSRCGELVARSGRATVTLGQDLAPQRSARGVATQPGCVVPVRVSTSSGAAAAGAVIDVRGVGHRQGDAVTLVAPTVTTVAAPGFLDRARARAGRVIDELYGRQAPLARALLIADERDIAPEVRRAFADAGIIHMLSVSGLHVAVLAESVLLAFLLCGAGVRRAELAAVAVTVAFVAFVGAPPPAVRAGAMSCVLVASRRLQRPTSPWAILALGAILPLGDPRAVVDVGYQLSVAGMAGLIASGSLIRRLPRREVPGWVSRLTREMVATIVASAVTAPIVAWHFGRLSLAAPLTNLAVAPLFAVAQPALFLSLLIAPVRPVARFVADGTGVLLTGITHVATIAGSIPGAALEVMPSLITAIFAAGASIALIAACGWRRWVPPVLAGAWAIAAALWWPVFAGRSSRMEMHMIDVGQGDAIALRTPMGRWIVIDAGESWSNGDAGARTVAPYLRHRGGDVAALILTHPHSDHIGGAASLLRLMRVGAIYDGGLVYGSEAYDELLRSARAHRVAWRLARAGETLSIDGVRILFVGPDSATAEDARDANEASVVALVEYNGMRLLLTGDAEHAEEARILAQFGTDVRADVLKVGHHGSSTSSGDSFLDLVHPRLALVSVGAGNHYGHPSAEVMQDLRMRGIQVLRTDENGSVVVSSDGKALQIRSQDAVWQLRLGTRAP
jgi:competence protein ComEC